MLQAPINPIDAHPLERYGAASTNKHQSNESTMRIFSKTTKAIFPALLMGLVAGCAEEKTPAAAAPSASAKAAAAPSAAPSAVAATPPPQPSASTPVHDCPPDTAGDGTLAKPCDAKGTARMMEVTWTGKMDDAGPSFRVVNKGKETILYGKVYAYFYDKAGKQLEVKDSEGKMHPNKLCFGNIFSGVMKPNEKAVITFSCIKKEHVPEGTAAIEAEMQTVGFADATEKRNEYYWRNPELNPDQRPKGGVKKK